jgi:hypothetical protein
MKASVIFLMLQLSLGAFGAAKNFPQVGAHYPVFVFEKNENPQNVMVAYVKLTDGCQFEKDPNFPSLPLFDFYWLMNRERFKPVHPLIKQGVRKRIEVGSQGPEDRSFVLRLKDLTELNTNLKAKEILVSAHKAGKNCDVDGIIGLEIAGEQELIRLEKIYSQSKKILRPPFRKVQSITLSGFGLKDKEKIERTFTASR